MNLRNRKQSLLTMAHSIHMYTKNHWSTTKLLVYSAMFAVLAALLQSAGGYVPAVGFLISPFTTLPLILVSVISLRYGLFAYVLTAGLLLLIEPTELFIFPFTTGVLGVSIGWGLVRLRRVSFVILFSSVLLFLGICFPLYVLEFPVFGPITTKEFHWQILTGIYTFSVLYSVLWIGISRFFLKRIEGLFYR